MVYRVFRRPSIDLDTAPKSWEHREAKSIKVGAIVTNAGEVVEISNKIDKDDGREITAFTFLSGGKVEYYSDAPVYSFQ